jgi:hypothetical protein
MTRCRQSQTVVANHNVPRRLGRRPVASSTSQGIDHAVSSRSAEREEEAMNKASIVGAFACSVAIAARRPWRVGRGQGNRTGDSERQSARRSCQLQRWVLHGRTLPLPSPSRRRGSIRKKMDPRLRGDDEMADGSTPTDAEPSSHQCPYSNCRGLEAGQIDGTQRNGMDKARMRGCGSRLSRTLGWPRRDSLRRLSCDAVPLRG